MNIRSLVLSTIITLMSAISFAKSIQLPPGSCVDYISVQDESEIECSSSWHASSGSGSASCSLTYSIKIDGVAQLEELYGGGYVSDGRHTGLLGWVTAGVSEVVWQGLIKPSILTDEALAEATSNYRFLKAHMCR